MLFNQYVKKDIRDNYIQHEMESDTDISEFKLTKRFISWLFNHYYCWEYSVNFYDEIEASVYDYDTMTYTGEIRPRTWDERICFNNWVDLFGEGIWGMNQRQVDQYAKQLMNDFRKAGHINDSRCWIGNLKWEELEFVHVYLYGRDIHTFDLHFIMRKRGSTGRKQYYESQKHLIDVEDIKD